jgi:hypothetical protein
VPAILRGDDPLVAAAVRQRPADHFFRAAVGVLRDAVHRGGVDEVDAKGLGPVDRADRFVVVYGAVKSAAHRPRAEPVLADGQTGVAERSLSHDGDSFPKHPR